MVISPKFSFLSCFIWREDYSQTQALEINGHLTNGFPIIPNILHFCSS